MNNITRVNKVGIESNYLVLDQLPSKQRGYPQINEILVRGLLFDEVKSLSKYLGSEAALRQLVNAYSDVIILNNTESGENFPLNILEMVDFHYLMVTSTLLTVDDASVKFSYICDNCNEHQNDQVELTALKYDVEFTDLIGGKVPVADEKYNVHPLKVIDLIKMDDSDILRERYKTKFKLDLDSDIFKDLLSYAVCLDWTTDDDLFNNINIINSDRKLLREIIEVTDQLSTNLEPIQSKCKSCGYLNKLMFDFSSVRGYL